MSWSTIFQNQRVAREIHKQVIVENSSGQKVWHDEKIGDEEVIYNVAVDPDQLAQMARIAARNKSQRCKDGAVLVEIVTRRRL